MILEKNQPRKKERPKETVLPKVDAVFFYTNALGHTPEDLKKHNKISRLAMRKRYGFEIKFSQEACKDLPPENQIVIYEKGHDAIEQFFRHLRNAFAHLYIEIDGNRCRILDWNPYNGNKKQRFAHKLITMYGDIEYDAFKSLINDLFPQNNPQNI